MKAIFQYTSYVAFAVFSVFNFSACHDDKKSEPTPDYFAALESSWELTSVTYNGDDQQGYEDFVLTLSETSNDDLYSYTTTLRPPLSPWKESGTWKLGTSADSQIVRDPGTADELAVTYTVSDTQLVLSFDFTGAGYSARTSSVAGEWVFTFSKKN